MELEAQKAVMALMKNNPGVLAHVPKANQFRKAVPQDKPWPFSRFGPTQRLPFKGACFNGGIVSFAIHVFTRTDGDAELAEQAASDAGKAIWKALDGARVQSSELTFGVQCETASVMMDPAESKAFHAVLNVRCRTLGV